jgi:flagellar hook-associated protein 2
VGKSVQFKVKEVFMSFYFNTNNSINPIDTLVQMFKQSESSKLVKPVEMQKNLIQTKNATLSDLKTKLNSLFSIVKDLSLTGVKSNFQIKTAEISNPEIFSAVVESYATPANHTIFVQQLAKEDTVISSKFSKDGNEILNSEGAGVKTIRVTINGVSTDLNVDVASGDTNSTILNKIASAVNSALSDVIASVVNDTPTTARLVIKSKNTGSQYAISLSDVSGNLLANIGLDLNVISNRIASTDTSGGYLYSDVNLLDAKLTVDGINIVRGSNKISDVISGITIELKKVQNPGDTPVSLTIKTDASKVREKIESFINAYNDLIKFINDKTKTTTDGTRSVFSGDYTLVKLKSELRLKISNPVAGEIAFLSDLGIKINTDGSLSIVDSAKLDKLISTDITKVESLFNSSDGIAVRLKEFINPFVQIGGVVDQRINSGKEQIKRLDERIKSLNNLIDERAEDLRRQFAQLQSLYNAFVRQQAMVQQLTQILVP